MAAFCFTQHYGSFNSPACSCVSITFLGTRLTQSLTRALLYDAVWFGFGRLAINPGYKGTMHIQSQFIITIAALAFASGLPNQVRADELKEAKVTQVIQD